MGFLDKMDTSGDCHLWTGRLDRDGYGTWGKDLAHRVVFRHFKGDIPKGMVIRHTCDNPSCVNPEHLLMGTQKENVRDCIARGRRGEDRGLNIGNRKLSVEDAKVIIALRNAGHTFESIAQKFGVSGTLIQLVVKGKHWTAKELEES